MRVNDFIRKDGRVFRILEVLDDSFLIIDCANNSMPIIIKKEEYERAEGPTSPPIETLSPYRRSEALKRYSLIAAAVAVVADESKRSRMIEQSATMSKKSKQTIRAYLRTYLIYQNIAALAPKEIDRSRALTQDEKNMRWGLNKFFYTQNKNSLPTAYRMLLNAKYCDDNGQLLAHYPSFNQFEYFYRKTRKLENFHISRNGLKDYQKNERPLLGDGVQEYAPNIGTAMLDGTVCDIYLINESGELVGRPILVVAVDANTSMCLGYCLLWEGGVYSLQQLLLCVLEDKVSLCLKFGIKISKEQWDVDALPGIIVTDKGKEYTGVTFEQIAELGVTLINLPSFRPELKGVVEKFFDLIQESFKEILKGKGVIMPD